MRYVFAVTCDVSNIADVLLEDTRYPRLASLQRLRRVPNIYGLLSYILTTLGDSKIRIICEALAGIEGLTHRCFTYDGFVAEFYIGNARKTLIESLPSSSTLIGRLVLGSLNNRGSAQNSAASPFHYASFSLEKNRTHWVGSERGEIPTLIGPVYSTQWLILFETGGRPVLAPHPLA